MKKAEKKGMDMNSYIIFMAVHGVEGISPEIMVRIQNVVNGAVEAAYEMDKD